MKRAVLALLACLLALPAAADGFARREGVTTNLQPWSQEWNATAHGSNWGTVNSTYSQNATAAPDGTTTADAVVSAITLTDVCGSSTLDITVSANTRYTLSAYLKEGEEGPWVYLGHRNRTAAAEREYAWFNLATGVRGSTGGTGTVHDYGIDVLPNGWRRVWMSITTQAGETALGFRQFKASGDTATTDAVTSGNVLYYGWAAQVEANPRPTHRVLTESAAASKTAPAAMGGDGFN